MFCKLVGIMEKKMETTIIYQGINWGYIGIMKKANYNMIIGYILGLHRDNGKENGNY